LGACLAAAPAQAQLSRTFVSAATGNDNNNCDRPTPCRTFQIAHNKTNDQGEITVLDPGGYGGITITKSISIVNDGVGEASTLVSGGGAGIKIAGGPATYVNLRGITVQGIGFGGGTGLVFVSGLSLTVTNCVFRNHSQDGILITPIVSGTVSNVSIVNTLVADNGNTGIRTFPGASVELNIVLDGVEIVSNRLAGMAVSGSPAPTNVTVTDSISADNGADGFVVGTSAQDALTSLTLIRTVSANNANVGAWSAGTPKAIVRISHSTITANRISWTTAGGSVFQSFGDNYIAGNADGDPPPPKIAQK
jgi:hypothetical protein